MSLHVSLHEISICCLLRWRCFWEWCNHLLARNKFCWHKLNVILWPDGEIHGRLRLTPTVTKWVWRCESFFCFFYKRPWENPWDWCRPYRGRELGHRGPTTSQKKWGMLGQKPVHWGLMFSSMPYTVMCFLNEYVVLSCIFQIYGWIVCGN